MVNRFKGRLGDRLSFIRLVGLIEPVLEGEFRLELFLEDIVPTSLVYVQPDRLRDQLIPEDREEIVGTIGGFSIPVSNFGVYYFNRIDKLESNYFEVAMQRLMWLNEGIDFEGLKKLTEYIHSRWIKDTKKIGKRDILKALLESVNMDINSENITHTKNVFYSRSSLLSSKEKMRITIRYRNEKLSALLGELIHESAMVAIEVHELSEESILKLGKTQVLREVQTRRAISTVRTMVKHMQGRTASALVEYNVDKIFKTKKAYVKYKKFLTLPEYTGNREMSRRLGVSLSTVQQYKSLRDGK